MKKNSTITLRLILKYKISRIPKSSSDNFLKNFIKNRWFKMSYILFIRHSFVFYTANSRNSF